MTRIEDRLRATLDHYAVETTVSPDAFESLDRRRSRRRLAGWPLGIGLAAAGVAAVVGAALLVAPTDSASPDPLAPSGATVEQDWADLTLDQAVDRLVVLNEGRSERAPLAVGQERVVRTVGAATHTGVEGEGSTVRYVAEEEVRIAADGTMRHAERVIDASVPMTATLQDLQRIVAEPRHGAFSDFEPIEPIDDPALVEAEQLSHGSAEPVPGRTERPDQSYAFMRMLDAFRYAPLATPEDTISSLELIARVHAVVEYRGLVQDLLGRDAVAFAGYDHANASWMVALFDPSTGAFIGEYEEYTAAFPGAEGVEPPILGSIGVLVSETIEPAS